MKLKLICILYNFCESFQVNNKSNKRIGGVYVSLKQTKHFHAPHNQKEIQFSDFSRREISDIKRQLKDYNETEADLIPFFIR